MSGPIPGLSAAQREALLSIFAGVPAVREAVLFGSRAKGTHRNGSDIDLAIKGEGLTPALRNELLEKYGRLFLPWKLDLVIYPPEGAPELREHIDRAGRVVFSR